MDIFETIKTRKYNNQVSNERTTNEKSTVISRVREWREFFMNFHIQFIAPNLAIKLLTMLMKRKIITRQRNCVHCMLILLALHVNYW